MEDEKYKELRKRYPKYVSKEQLYVICRISKRTAKYLLDSGIIPCEDTGKKTRRYRVALKDIIAYLKKRDSTGNTQVPHGSVSSRKIKGPRTCYAQAIMLGQEEEVRRYFEYIFSDFPHVLNLYDIAEMTGLAYATVQRLIRSNAIRSWLVDGRRMVPKAYMLDFVASTKFLNTKSNSLDFQRILGGFHVWQGRQSASVGSGAMIRGNKNNK